VLSSDSRRTRETWAALKGAFEAPPAPDWRPDLYHAGPETLYAALRQAQGGTVLLLGHNPGCAYFAAAMVSFAPDHHRFDDYPTAATLVADLPGHRWDRIGWGTAEPVAFVVPRDLGVD